MLTDHALIAKSFCNLDLWKLMMLQTAKLGKIKLLSYTEPTSVLTGYSMYSLKKPIMLTVGIIHAARKRKIQKALPFLVVDNEIWDNPWALVFEQKFSNSARKLLDFSRFSMVPTLNHTMSQCEWDRKGKSECFMNNLPRKWSIINKADSLFENGQRTLKLHFTSRNIKWIGIGLFEATGKNIRFKWRAKYLKSTSGLLHTW